MDGFMYCEETVNTWMEDLNEKLNKNTNNKQSIIKEEIKDATCDLSNQHLWLTAASNEEEVEIHEQNIANTKEYIERLKELKTA